MTVHEASIHIKRTEPRRRIACSGVHLCAETTEKPYFKRFSGIEKVHHNSMQNYGGLMVDPEGFEPLTSALRTQRSPS